MSAQKKRAVTAKTDRVPVSGLRDILTVYGKNPAFEYRFVVDVDERGSRIQRFMRGGWEFTQGGEQSEVIVGEQCVYRSEESGSIIRYPSGGGKHSYLMQIERELYEEDQRAKQREINDTENIILRQRTDEDNEHGQYSGRQKVTDELKGSETDPLVNKY